MSRPPEIRVRRVYDSGDERVAADHRILVDRLWPRGVSKSDAAWDEWLKDVAPSAELRRWYDHDPARFLEFARRYRAELRRSPAATAIDRLAELARSDAVTLLTATRDVEHSGARVLQDTLTSRRYRSRRRAPEQVTRSTVRSS